MVKFYSENELKELADKNRKERIKIVRQKISDYVSGLYKDCKFDAKLNYSPDDIEPENLEDAAMELFAEQILSYPEYLTKWLKEWKHLNEAGDEEFMYDTKFEY